VDPRARAADKLAKSLCMATDTKKQREPAFKSERERFLRLGRRREKVKSQESPHCGSALKQVKVLSPSLSFEALARTPKRLLMANPGGPIFYLLSEIVAKREKVSIAKKKKTSLGREQKRYEGQTPLCDLELPWRVVKYQKKRGIQKAR